MRKFDTAIPVTSGVRLPTTQVARRYDVTPRTVERWEDDAKLNFPKPLVINRRKYWPLEALELWERNRVAAASA